MLQPGRVQSNGRRTVDWGADPTFAGSADLRGSGKRETNIAGDRLPERPPFGNGTVRV